MLKTKNKRGELTTTQIVSAIVLIATIIIILIWYTFLNLKGETDQQICRNSVMLVGQKEPVPSLGDLNCRSNYVCISGGGECSDLMASERIKINPEDKGQVMKALADKMVECWWEFGEGKIDYSDPTLLTKTECSVCSLVGFNDQFATTAPISYRTFYNYLATTKKDSSQTYLQYLYKTNSLSDIESGLNPEGYLNNKIDPKKIYFILTGITKTGVLRPQFSQFWGTPFEPQPVVILENNKTNYDSVGCNVFLTKA